MSSQHVTAYNVTDRPQLVDEAGHMLDGDGFGCVDSHDELVKTLLRRGVLTEVDDPGDLSGLSPAAQAAILATREANAPKRKTPKAAASVDTDSAETKEA